MPTDTLPSPFQSPARNFAVTALAASLGVFGLLKLGWVEAHVMLPFTEWQGRLAVGLLGAPVLPIDVTLACSGADAFALCAGAILAYPAAWRLRLSGTVMGFALILLLNTLRIGTLGRAAASPVLFQILHVYVWPLVLILAIAGYVFWWMQLANTRPQIAAREDTSVMPSAKVTGAFFGWAVISVLLFVAVSPLYLQSTTVMMVAAFIARAAGGALHVLGIEAKTTANVLWTSKGGFEVTQECISTPLIPLYFAAVMAYGTNWRRRALAFAAALPLFVALGIARLLVVALPAALIGSPLFLIHAFYQILLAAVVVCAAVAWRRGAPAWRVSALACLAGALCMYLLGPVYAAIFSRLVIDLPFNDAQGAMASLPSFQAGLFVALAIATMTRLAWPVLAKGFGILLLVQAAAFAVLLAASRYSEWMPHIRDVRAWAIAAPLAIVVIGLIAHDRTRH